jgi:hypothetical protein
MPVLTTLMHLSFGVLHPKAADFALGRKSAPFWSEKVLLTHQQTPFITLASRFASLFFSYLLFLCRDASR